MEIAVRVGAAERLVKRRGRAPTERERAMIRAALDAGRQRP